MYVRDLQTTELYTLWLLTTNAVPIYYYATESSLVLPLNLERFYELVSRSLKSTPQPATGCETDNRRTDTHYKQIPAREEFMLSPQLVRNHAVLVDYD